MTTNKNDNLPGRTSPAGRADGKPQAHVLQSTEGYRDGEQLDPRNDRGQGPERTQQQGRGGDADRG